jgi:mRNA interferase HigB
VRIVSRKRIREFGSRFAKAIDPLNRWANVVEASRWAHPGERKAAFAAADFVKDLTVFNIGGNKFRLIAFVHYGLGIVYIKHILTHEEYEQGAWKK